MDIRYIDLSDPSVSDWDVELSPTHVIGAALIAAPYSCHVPSWRLTIDVDGHVVHEIRHCEAPDYVDRYEKIACQIGEASLQDLVRMVDDVGLSELKGRYEAQVSSQEITSITVRTANGIKRVRAYGAWSMASEGNVEMQRYVELWNAIYDVSPYKGQEPAIPEPAPARTPHFLHLFITVGTLGIWLPIWVLDCLGMFKVPITDLRKTEQSRDTGSQRSAV